MIAYFILGIALFIGAMLLVNWFVTAEPKQVVRAARWILVGLVIVVVLVFILAGRQALALFALPALLPLFMRYRMLWRRLKSAAGPKPGQASEVNTRFIHMTLDHDSGTMDGEVQEGRFAGRMLGTLSLEDLTQLWRQCRDEDPQSAAVLEAYLDRTQGEAWREAAGAGSADGEQAASSDGAPMSREEAYAILGLESGASKGEVRDAHHRLMQKIHPDHGGSNYLAAKINQAKDLLLDA